MNETDRTPSKEQLDEWRAYAERRQAAGEPFMTIGVEGALSLLSEFERSRRRLTTIANARSLLGETKLWIENVQCRLKLGEPVSPNDLQCLEGLLMGACVISDDELNDEPKLDEGSG